MSRYIDADALISKAITRFFNEDYFSAIITMIDNIPTADVVYVKHGKWLLDGRCSECLVAPLTSHRNYCPNCGAKMDERGLQ
mgnify:CR=1 FL=1